MALERQVVNLNFARGMNTQPDQKQLDPGEFVLASNVTYETPKQVQLRNGMAPQATSILGGGNLAAGKWLTTVDGALVLSDGSSAYQYNTATSSWRFVGSMKNMSVTVYKTVPFLGLTAQLTDCALNVANDQILVLWNQSDGSSEAVGVGAELHYAVLQYSTGALLYTGLILTAVNNTLPARAVAVASRFILATAQGYYKILCATPQTVTAIGASTVTGGATGYHDAIAVGTSAYFVVKGATGPTIWCESVASNDAITARTTGETCTATFGALVYDGTNIMVAYAKAAGTGRGIVFNTALNSTITAATNITNSTPSASSRFLLGLMSGSLIRVVYSAGGEAANGSSYRVGTVPTNLSSTITETLLPPNLVPQTRAWMVGNELSFLASYSWASGGTYGYMMSKATNATFFVVTIDGVAYPNTRISVPTAFPLGEGQPYRGTGSGTANLAPSGGAWYDSTGNKVALAYPSFVGLNLLPSTSTTPIRTMQPRVALLDYSPSVATAAVGTSAFASGGQLWQADGDFVYGAGWYLLPEFDTVAQGAAGNLADGDYSLSAVFVYTDAAGNVYRSSPAAAQSFTVTAGGGTAKITASVTNPTTHAFYTPTFVLGLGMGPYQPTIELYRSEKGGTILYLDSVMSGTGSSGTVTATWGVTTDANLVANRQLYTTGGQLPNVWPAAPNTVIQHRDRLWAISAHDTTSLIYSQPIVPGAAVEWSDALTLIMPTGNEALTAIASLDDKLVAFTATKCFYVVGDGPGLNGLGGAYSAFPLLAAQGCVNQASVCPIPEGVVFKSQKGFYLLDRGLALSYIGSPVEAYNAQSCVASYLAQDVRQARFLLSGGGAVVYHYNQRVWGTFTFGFGGTLPVANSAYQTKWAVLGANGTVFIETPGTYADSGVSVAQQMTTGWITFAGLQDWERIRRLIFLFDPNQSIVATYTVVVSIYYDWDDAGAAQTVTIPNSVLADPATRGAQFMIHLTRQKCDAIKVDIHDLTSNGAPGPAVRYSGLAFEVGVKRGFRKLPATNTAG